MITQMILHKCLTNPLQNSLIKRKNICKKKFMTRTVISHTYKIQMNTKKPERGYKTVKAQ